MVTSDRLRAVDRPLRWSLTGLVIAGAGFAVTAAVLAFAGGGVRDAIVYTVVATALSLVAIGIGRAVRWVVAMTLVVCAGQIAAVIGTVLELVYGVAPSKAAQLRRLGFDPDFGVSINLGYSTVAFGLFCWFAWRWRHAPRGRLP